MCENKTNLTSIYLKVEHWTVIVFLCRSCHIDWIVTSQCLQYKTDQAQDVKKVEKLHGKLMRLMVSKETHSGSMETDWSRQMKLLELDSCFWLGLTDNEERLISRRIEKTLGWCFFDWCPYAHVESKQQEHLTRGWYLCYSESWTTL